MLKILKSVVIVISSVMTIYACANTVDSRQEEMLILASALTKLSASVEATVRYDAPSQSLSESELLSIATKHDPSLLTPFSDYSLRVHSENRHAIVLVCTKDGKHSLLEDVGCSAKFDKHVWNELFKSKCDFSLNVNKVCAIN